MSAQFTNPLWLWLLLPAIGWVVWLARTSHVEIGPQRRWIACALRCICAASLILALAGIQWLWPVDGMNLFFLVDRSESVSLPQQEAARQWINQVIREKPQSDRAGMIVFGAEPGIESGPKSAPEFTTISTVVPGGRTDIGAAIQLAAAAFPETGQRRIVLLSDGNENLGDALNAAVSSRTLHADIDVVPLAGERLPDVSVQKMQVPSEPKRGQTFEAKVFVQSDQAGPATLRLYRNNQYFGEQKVDLEAGKNLLAFPQTLAEPGFYTYEVQVQAPWDRIPQNNRAIGFANVRGLPRILVISSDPEADRPLVDAIRSPEIEVRVTGVSGIPGSLVEWQSYDSIVLCNVFGPDLSAETQRQMESAVRDFGVGFVCIGGDQSYGAGAYKGTPLESLLPVDMELSSKKVVPAGALAIVIDKSGSMAGGKMEAARQAAMGAIDLLSGRDYAGVIAFDGVVYPVVEMQLVSDKRGFMNRIAGIQADGGTVMYPPMVRAFEMLQSVQAGLKHCIVMTDGQSQPGDFEGIARKMAEKRITVSTVGIGSDLDAPLLEKIAQLGRGRFYDVSTPEQIPQIFIRETAIVLKTLINEEPFVPRLAYSSELVRGIGRADYPPLLGYVATEPKPRAEVPLVTEKGDPLLAHWQYGLGKTAAFTSDARAKWAKSWVAWSQYQQFWRQVVWWSVRHFEDPAFVVDVAADRGDGEINLEALDENGRYRNFLDLEVTAAGPDASRQTIHLRQSGPGRYQGRFPMKQAGAYVLNVKQMENGKVRASQAVGVSLDHTPEIAGGEANLNLLRAIAERTDGKVLDPGGMASNPFLHDRHKSWQPYDLWPWLLELAIVLFVADAGIRRVHLEREHWEKFQHAVLMTAFRRRRAKPAAEAPSLASLLARRDEVRAQQGPDLKLHERIKPGLPPNAPSPFAMPMARTGEPVKTAEKIPDTPIDPTGTASRLLEAKRRMKNRNPD